MTKYIKLSANKLLLLCEHLDLVAKGSDPKKRSGALTDHIWSMSGGEKGRGARSTLDRQIKQCWNEEPGAISTPQFHRFVTALGLSETDQTIMILSDLGEFKSWLKSHEFPEAPTLVSNPELHLESEQQTHHLSPDLASLDLFSSKQLQGLSPILSLKVSKIRVPELGLSYGFTRVLIDLEFQGGKRIRLKNRIGSGNKPFKLGQTISLRSKRNELIPQFVLEDERDGVPLQVDEDTPPVGDLSNIVAGDRIKVTLRAELLSDVLSFDEINLNNQSAVEEIMALVVRGKLKRAFGQNDLELSRDGQFIKLVTQSVEVVEDVQN